MSKNKKITVAILIILVTGGIFQLSKFLFGFGISFPPNTCDLKIGYEFYPGSFDLLVGSRDLCLFNKGLENQSVHICNQISADSEHFECIRTVAAEKNDYKICDNTRRGNIHSYSKENCIKEVAVKNNNGELCRIITDGNVRGPCIVEIAKIEKSNKGYEEEALQLASTNLTDAIKKCKLVQEPINQKVCYGQVSNTYSGITKKNLFNPPLRLVNLCLGDPNEYEWLACIYGNIFNSLTGTDRLVPSFQEKVKSDPYRISTFCQLYVYEPGNPGTKEGYGGAIQLRNEICDRH